MKFSTIVTVYILFVFFIPSSISLINVQGFPLLSINRIYVLLWIIVFLWLLFSKKWIRAVALSYPFYKPMTTVILSMSVVTVFAQDFGASVNFLISFITESFLLSLMIWVAYRKPNDVLYVMRKLVIVFVALAIYGTVAHLAGTNPVMDYINTNFASDTTRRLVFSYDSIERLGVFGRAQSIFSHAIQYGIFLIMIFCISYYLYLKESGTQKYLNLLYMAILVSSVAFTNSRTPILFLLVIITIYWFFQSVAEKLKIAAAGLILLIVIIPFASDTFAELFLSIFTELSGGQSSVGGSSSEMRLDQLNAAINLFSESPIIGHGLMATRVMLEGGTLPTELYGAESELYWQMIDSGIVGVVTQAYFYYFMVRYFLNQNQRVMVNHLRSLSLLAVALVLGYFVSILITGVIYTTQLFIIIITLVAKYIYCSSQQEFRINEKGSRVKL